MERATRPPCADSRWAVLGRCPPPVPKCWGKRMTSEWEANDVWPLVVCKSNRANAQGPRVLTDPGRRAPVASDGPTCERPQQDWQVLIDKMTIKTAYFPTNPLTSKTTQMPHFLFWCATSHDDHSDGGVCPGLLSTCCRCPRPGTE